MDESGSGRSLAVLTFNTFFGADLSPLFASRTLADMVGAVGKVWHDVQASDMPARAAGIAQAIVAEKPDIVALQEVARWSSGSFGALSPKIDFLQLILDALHATGAHYQAIGTATALDQAAPYDAQGNFLRFEDRQAVLVRTDTAEAIRIDRVESETFAAVLAIPGFITGPMNVPRSWIAIDATFAGKPFRLISTHLESHDDAVQAAQARELIGMLPEAGVPAILIGDFNIHGKAGSGGIYDELIAAGLKDGWMAVHPAEPGNTCCRPGDLRSAASELDRRLDLVLTRGPVTPVAARLVAADAAARTPSGLWFSDHAGLLTTLQLD